MTVNKQQDARIVGSLLKPVLPALLFMAAALLSGCKSKEVSAGSASTPPLPVSVVKIEPTDVGVASEWVGTMDGYVNAQIQPQASGYLIRQLYNEIQQEAQAEANVKTAEAAVETAQLNLSFCQVRSLISGVAGQATVQVGNLVNTQSVLTSVSQLNPIKVYFSIGDSEYLALTHQASTGRGDLLKAAANVPLTLTLSNGQEYPAKGHIAFVDRQVNSQTGAIRIAAAFPNPNNVLRPGQFGRVKANTEIRHDAILVPQAAVVEFQGQQQIYTVTNDNKVRVNTVVLGPQHGSDWIIESGLPAHAEVIVDNLQKLREGAPVSPQIAPPQSASVAQGAAPTGR